jgi:hypothetical protein
MKQLSPLHQTKTKLTGHTHSFRMRNINNVCLTGHSNLLSDPENKLGGHRFA